MTDQQKIIERDYLWRFPPIVSLYYRDTGFLWGWHEDPRLSQHILLGFCNRCHHQEESRINHEELEASPAPLLKKKIVELEMALAWFRGPSCGCHFHLRKYLQNSP